MQHPPSSTGDTRPTPKVYMPSMPVQVPNPVQMDEDRTLQQVNDYDFDELLNFVEESQGNGQGEEGAEGCSPDDDDHDDTPQSVFVKGETSGGGGLDEETPLESMPDDRSWTVPAGDDK
ncbi:hypothetical protein QQ045_015665 [Rhodiola kirilowii]